MKIRKLHKPFHAQENTGVLFRRIFNSVLKEARGHQKNPMSVAPMSR